MSDDLFEDFFVEADALASVDTETTKSLSEMVRSLRSTEDEIARVEQYLKELTDRKHKLSTEGIPVLMDEMGVERVDVDGVTVTRKMVVAASIPVARREEAFDWLRQNVWQHGSRFSTSQLITQATGEDLNIRYFREHLTSRYL